MKIIAYTFTFLIASFLVFLIAISFNFFFSQLNLIFFKNKYQWKKTTAIIEKIKMEETPDLSLDESLSSLFSFKKCRIKYSYTYNNKKRFGNSIGLNKNRFKNEKYKESIIHQEIFNKLEKSKKIIIYVNPKSPEQSVIIKYDFIFEQIGKGLLTLIFPLVFIYITYDQYKRPANYIADKIELAE